MSVADTVATAVPVSEIASVLPYVGGGGASAFAVFVLFYYRDLIIGFGKKMLGGERDDERKQILADVASIQQTLKLHTVNEEERFSEIEHRLVEVETKQETASEVMKMNHEETLRELSRIYEQIGMLTKVLLERK